MTAIVRLAARNVRALVHYRPEQIARRSVSILAARLRLKGRAPAPGGAVARPLPLPEPLLAYFLHPSVTPPERVDEVNAGGFRFLGESRPTPVAPLDWMPRGPSAPSHLWRMHLHYHRFVVDAAAAAARGEAQGPRALRTAAELLARWEIACDWRDRRGRADAWHPYSVSTRLLNARAAVGLLHGIQDAAAAPLRHALSRISAFDAAYLESRLEYDLGGNHLLRNACALAAAASWAAGSAVARWSEVAGDVLREELGAQFLSDGAHEERTAMYQALALEDLALAALAGHDARRTIARHATRISGALRSLLHPDGGIAQFNDAARESIGAPETLASAFESVCDAAAGRAADLPHAGYFRLQDGPSLAIFDAGALGPDHLPAHAHCDALSFEWSLGGRRIVVDTGIDRYEAGEARSFQRSTAAHATLQPDGFEQGEPFGSFRMGARPNVAGGRLGPSAAWGRHDGFGRLGRHYRSIEVSRDGASWEDRLDGAHEVAATVRVGLAPGSRVEVTPSGARFDVEGAGSFAWTAPPGTVDVEAGIHCPDFGVAVPRPVLTWRGLAGRGRPLSFALRRVG